MVAVTGPDNDDLNAASAGRRLAALVATGGISSRQLQEAVAAQSYTVTARALGVDDEEAQRVLREVVDELVTAGGLGDRYAIAQRRLAEGSNFRPPEELREAARQMLAAAGYSLHPEHVDAHAWQLKRVVAAYAPYVPWYKRWWRRVRNILRGGR